MSVSHLARSCFDTGIRGIIDRPSPVCDGLIDTVVSIRSGCEALPCPVPRSTVIRPANSVRQKRQQGQQAALYPRASTCPAADNGLTAQERAEVIETLNSPRFADPPPAEVYATLASDPAQRGSLCGKLS